MSSPTFDLSLSSNQIASRELVSLLKDNGLKNRTVMRRISNKSPNQKLRALIWQVACNKPRSLSIDEWLGYGGLTIVFNAQIGAFEAGDDRLRVQLLENALSKKLKHLFSKRKGMEFFDAACQSVNFVTSADLAQEVLEVDNEIDSEFVNAVLGAYEVKLAGHLVSESRNTNEAPLLAKRYRGCSMDSVDLPKLLGKTKKCNLSKYTTKAQLIPFFAETISERALAMQGGLID